MRSLRTLFKIVIPTILIFAFASFFLFFSSEAASLTAVYVYLSRIQAGLNGSGGQAVSFVLAVATAQAMASGGTVKIEFPDEADSTWCRSGGFLTVTGVSSSQADLTGTTWQIDEVLPSSGTLAATCTQGGEPGSVDTITISNVGALTAGTTYGVRVSSNAGVIGTNSTAGQHELTVTVSSGAAIDSKSFKISLISNDSVVVSATVSESPSVNCTISTNAVNLGTLYPGGAYAIGSHTISTSATIGYYWAAYGTGDGSTDAGLYKSTATTYLIPSGSSATLNLTTAGSEGFGLTVSDPDGVGGAVVAPNFVDTTPGTFGTLDRLYTGAKLLINQNGLQSTAENATITYGARASTSAPAGNYQETVTFICGGYY